MLTASHAQSLRDGLRPPHLLTVLSDGPWGGIEGQADRMAEGLFYPLSVA